MRDCRPAIAAEIAAIELEIPQLKAAQGHQAAGAVELRERIADLHWVDWATVPAEDRRAIYAAVAHGWRCWGVRWWRWWLGG